MSGIKAFSSSLKHLNAPSAHPTAKTEQQFVTMTPTGYDKHGLDVVLKAHYPIVAIPTVIDAIQPTEDADRVLFVTGHGLRQGDIVRFAVGSSLEGIESEIVKIVDANTLVLATKLPTIPVAGVDSIDLLRGVTLRTSANGTLQASSGPIEWVLDGASQQLIEDTATPANNRFAPVAMSFDRDGVATRIVKDTATPANTRAMPVELVSVDGIEATFNVSTGDLNVALTHDGVASAFDSTRIGDGTNIAGVNAALELLTRDGDAIAALGSLLTELQLKADLTETQPVSAASLPLPTGAATEATLEAARVLLASIAGEDFATQTTLAALLTELQLKADLTETQPVSMASAPLPTGAATETTLAALAAEDFATQTTLAALLTELALKADLTETQPVSAAALPLPTGAATEATLAALAAEDFATETTLAAQSAKLPAALGSTTSAASLSVTLASDEAPIETTKAPNDGGVSSRALTLATTAVTIPAPAGANKVYLQAASNNTTAIFVGLTAGVTDATGWELLPGASVEFEAGVDAYYYSTVGSERLNYTWTTRS